MKTRFLAPSILSVVSMLGGTGCPDANNFETGLWVIRISTEVHDYGLQMLSEETVIPFDLGGGALAGEFSYTVSNGTLRIVRQTENNTYVYQGPLTGGIMADGTYYIEGLPYVIGEWSAVNMDYLGYDPML